MEAPGALVLRFGALGVLTGLAGLTACGAGDDGDAGRRPVDREASGTAAPEVDLATTEVCDLVRQGIDAFNLGDLAGTVERFEEAVPPAEDLAEDEPSDDTRTLLDAVRYYAALPLDEYVEASQESPEFLRYKDFTLTECAYGSPPDGATDPAVPA